MTVLLKPTCCPASPCSFRNDLPLFTSPPLGLQQRELWQIVAHSEAIPTQQEHTHAGLSLPAHENTLYIPPRDRFFSPPIIEMIPRNEPYTVPRAIMTLALV